MKILIITNNQSYNTDKACWGIFTKQFIKLGHSVKYLGKKSWLAFPIIYYRFKPDIVVSIGRHAGLITGFFPKYARNCSFVFVLNDHPYFYKSEKRIKKIISLHDLTLTSSLYNVNKFGAKFVSYGSEMTEDIEDLYPLIYTKIRTNIKNELLSFKSKKYDCFYVGQIHGFYGIEKLKEQCKNAGISFKVVNDNFNRIEVANIMAQSKVCVFPISWDSSGKTMDYAMLGMPVVALKPNYLQGVKYPAYYTANLVQGIKYLSTHPEEALKLGREARKWYVSHAKSMREVSKEYLAVFQKLITKPKIFSMDVEKDIHQALNFSNTLIKYGQVGEFYITGQMLEKYPKQVKQIAKNHIICAHGYNHEDFSKLSYPEAEAIILKTFNLFKKHKINMVGWRFPGFKFKNSQLKLLIKYRLFDSSVRDAAMLRWKGLIHIRNFLSNMKRRKLFFPVKFPRNLDERPWSKIDLNDSSLYLKQGRLVFHCYHYKKIKKEFENYLKRIS